MSKQYLSYNERENAEKLKTKTKKKETTANGKRLRNKDNIK